MQTLEEYLLFAEKLIKKCKYIKKTYMQITDDFISYVACRIIDGDKNFDINKVSIKNKDEITEEECRKKYLRQCGIFGIRAYLYNLSKKEKKEHNFSEFQKIENVLYTNSKYEVKDILSSLCEEEEKQEQKNYLNVLINSSGLTQNEVNIIKKYINGQSFHDIAREHNVSANAIHLSYKNAVGKMSNMVR